MFKNTVTLVIGDYTLTFGCKNGIDGVSLRDQIIYCNFPEEGRPLMLTICVSNNSEEKITTQHKGGKKDSIIREIKPSKRKSFTVQIDDSAPRPRKIFINEVEVTQIIG